jgi:hypothetical protein
MMRPSKELTVGKVVASVCKLDTFACNTLATWLVFVILMRLGVYAQVGSVSDCMCGGCRAGDFNTAVPVGDYRACVEGDCLRGQATSLVVMCPSCLSNSAIIPDILF